MEGDRALGAKPLSEQWTSCPTCPRPSWNRRRITASRCDQCIRVGRVIGPMRNDLHQLPLCPSCGMVNVQSHPNPCIYCQGYPYHTRQLELLTPEV